MAKRARRAGAGIPSQGQVNATQQSFNKNPGPRPATQGSSVANMGDGMNANGHNVPRGYFATKDVARGAAAGGGGLGAGSTPLSKTGTVRGGKKRSTKYNPASSVSGPYF